jgi:Glycosyl hydrolases family 16
MRTKVFDSNQPSGGASMKILWLVVLMFVCQILASGQTPPPQASGYTLAFSDDFTSLNMNSASNPNNPAVNWYNPGPYWYGYAPWANYSTPNGSGVNLNWTTGQSGHSTTGLSTCSPDGRSHCQAWNYGYFEASLRFDVVTGAWPAFWMTPKEGYTLPSGSEVGEWDIMEFNTPQMQLSGAYAPTAHQWSKPGGVTDCTTTYNTSSINSSTFNTYGLLWTPNTLKFYFNNNLINTCTIDNVTDAQHYFIVLASQVGANWSYGNTSGVSSSTISADFDWVHVWQPGSGSQPPPAAPSAPTGLTATVN